MSKCWSYEDDMWLVVYFDAVGDSVGPFDLGRPKGAATRRVAKLKATGVWEKMRHADRAVAEARAHHALAFSRDEFVREVATDTLAELAGAA